METDRERDRQRGFVDRSRLAIVAVVVALIALVLFWRTQTDLGVPGGPIAVRSAEPLAAPSVGSDDASAVTVPDGLLREVAPTDARVLFAVPAITGVVTDVRGQPIEGVTVRTTSEEPSTLLTRIPCGDGSVITDADGGFALSPIDRATRALRFAAPRHVGQVILHVDPGDHVRVALVDGVPLAGRVVDDDSGAPVSGAEVALDGPTVVTDASGVFATVIPTPCVGGLVRAPGYQDWCPGPLTPDSSGAPLLVRLRRPVADGHAEVTFLDRITGEPIADVHVVGGSVDLGDGRHRVPLHRWPAARALSSWFEVAIHAEGYPALWWDPGEVENETFSLTAELHLPRAVNARGVVLDPDGRPLAGARVMAFAERPRDISGLPDDLYPVRWRETSTTDAAGAFEIPQLAAGFTCRVRVHHRDFSTANTAPVPVPDEGALDLPPIRLEPTLSIAGDIRDAATGAPVAGARVAGGGASTMSDASGAFALSGIDAARREVSVHAEGYARVTADPAGSPVGVAIGLTRGEELAGRVVDNRGLPVIGVTVICWWWGEDLRQRRSPWFDGPVIRDRMRITGADGRFRFTELARHKDPGADQYVVGAILGRRPLASAKATLGDQAIELVLPALCGIGGRARRAADGAPVRELRVDGNWIPQNSEGAWFTALEPGVRRRVELRADGFGGVARVFTVEDGEVRTWDPLLVAEARVEGVVRDGTGAPVEGARIHLVPKPADDRLGARFASSKAGSFEVAGLGAGRYAIVLEDEHGDPRDDAFLEPAWLDLAVGDRREIELRLSEP